MSVPTDAIRATRWDRLCAVLEEVDPDRVIDASRIIERQKTLSLSDTATFQIMQLRYQDAASTTLSRLVHLYVLKDSWLMWLRRTEECLRAHRASLHGSRSRRDASSGRGVSRCTAQVDLREFWDSDEGTLDAFRDGTLLTTLVKECLSYTDAFVSLSAFPQQSSQQLSQLQYAVMFPSLPTVKGSSTSTGMGPLSGDITSDVSSSAPQSPLGRVRTSRSRRAGTRHALRTPLKQQEDTVRRVVSNLSNLNDLCATFLSWNERGSAKESFLPMETLEHSLAPTNKDDLVLLHRLHWLSLALYERVHNEKVVPPPPTVSFLLHSQFQSPKSTLQPDEDSDIAVIVATQFTYFPQSHQLEILSPSPRKVSIRHPKALAIQYDCVLVDKEAYVFDRQRHVFRPFWELMKHLLLLFEEKPWFFEMSALQREVEKALLGASAVAVNQAPSTRRNGAFRTSVPSTVQKTSGSREEGGRTVFELTVRTSTVKRVRAPQPSQRATISGDAPHTKLAATNTVQASAAAAGDVIVPVSTVQRRRQKEPTAVTARLAASAQAGAEVNASLKGGDKFAEQDANHNEPGSQSLSPLSRGSDIDAEGQSLEPDLIPEGSIYPHPLRLPSCNSRADRSSFTHQDDVVSEGGVPSCVLSEVHGDIVEHPPSSGCRRGEYANAVGNRHDLEKSQESSVRRYFSEVGHRQQLNFSAAVLQEGDQDGLAVTEHHFRVSGKPVGKGAFGAVYRALDLETGMTVAVKQSRYTLRGAIEDNVNWNELQLLSMLPAHPNVITFHGASKELATKQLLLVMEYASGGSIMSTYKDFWPIPEQLFFRHAREMALGLKHLHDHGVIHGDVKPENVLTRSNGSVALTDFGCSSVCHSTSTPGAVAAIVSPGGGGMSNSLSGTPPYMAPEVIFGSVDTKSDVWAFACTLLQLWLWELPWSDGHDVDVCNVVPLLFYIGSQEVVPFSDEQIERAPRWLQKIATRALVRSVDDRCNMAEILSIMTSYSTT